MNTNTLYAQLKNIVECRSEVTHVELSIFNEKLEGVTLEQVQKMVACINLLSAVGNCVKYPGPRSPIADAIVARFNTILQITENYEQSAVKEELSAGENDNWFWSGFNGKLFTHATEICAYYALANMGPVANMLAMQTAYQAISRYLGIEAATHTQQLFQPQQQYNPIQQPFQPNPRW